MGLSVEWPYWSAVATRLLGTASGNRWKKMRKLSQLIGKSWYIMRKLCVYIYIYIYIYIFIYIYYIYTGCFMRNPPRQQCPEGTRRPVFATSQSKLSSKDPGNPKTLGNKAWNPIKNLGWSGKTTAENLQFSIPNSNQFLTLSFTLPSGNQTWLAGKSNIYSWFPQL